MGFDATGDKPYKAAPEGPVWYTIVGAVVALAFGGAFVGAKFIGGGDPTATIATLVKGRNVPEAAGLINAYGFKDEATLSFLRSLQAKETEQHAELLTEMARSALNGANRVQLADVMMQWMHGYVEENAEFLRHADPKHVDQILPLIRQAFIELDKTGTQNCHLDQIIAKGDDPNAFYRLSTYGGGLYDVSVRLNTKIVDMVHSGRQRLANGASAKAMASATEMSQSDQNAIAAAMMSLMADPAIQKLMTSTQAGGAAPSANVCKIGMSFVGKIEELDPSVRRRLWFSAVSGQLGPIS